MRAFAITSLVVFIAGVAIWAANNTSSSFLSPPNHLQSFLGGSNKNMRGKQQQQQQHEEHEQVVIGGYSGVNAKKQRLQVVANFAVESLLGLLHQGSGADVTSYSFSNDGRMDVAKMEVDVLDAEQQVVEGINYKLQVVMRASGECIGAFHVNVWDRFGDMTVTRWGKEIPCDALLAKKEGDLGI